LGRGVIAGLVPAISIRSDRAILIEMVLGDNRGGLAMRRTLKITSKGQVTFRKEVLDQLGVRPGDRITVELVGSGRVKVRPARSGTDLAGSWVA
jgi:AbrB family looped-hinge helix DNA binding protein